MDDELRRFVDLIDGGQSAEAATWAKPRAERGETDAQFLMAYLVFGRTNVDKQLVTRLCGPSGAEYDVVVEVRWDDQPLDDVCVSATINDRGWQAAQDIYEIFSMSRDNQIVGDSF